MNTKGTAGEDIVCKYLEAQEFHIISRNYKSRYGEIDIIAEKGEYLIFTEVKARSKNSKGLPRESVDGKKQNRIIKTALMYLSENQSEKQIRFDVAEVFDYLGNNTVNYIENAFTMEAYNESY